MAASKGNGNTERLSDVVVVGGGTAGWMVAAALARYFNDGRRRIVLIESDAIGIVGVGEATIPPIREFNSMLGISENEFLAATRGTFKLGIEFVNWGEKGDRYIHPFGHFGQDLHGIPFHQLYLREEGLRGAEAGLISDYSMSSTAAAMSRFGRPNASARPPLSELRYAYHFDASLYAKYLRALAERQGTTRIEGKIKQVHRDPDSGDIISVGLDNGQTIAGQLFIDCSGFRGLLIEEALQTGYEDWSHWLPMDRAWALPSSGSGSPDPFTRATAHDAGWQWRIPLQHRTGNGHVFSSAFTSEERARDVLTENLEGQALAEPRMLRFRAGMRNQVWSHNVVSLGLSSGFLEPLESTSIHLVQNGIQRLFAYFPDWPICPRDREDYNRGMRELYEDVRDFVILHYKATQRDDTEFWRYVRDMDVPDSLSRRMDQWQRRGRVFRENAELFTLPSWVAVMLGQNIRPEMHDPIADTLDPDKVRVAMQRMRAEYRGMAEQLPTQEEFMRQAGAWHTDAG